MRIRDAGGFTLIELLIVVAIIGIIAAVALPGLLRARQSGNESSAVGSLSAINKAQLAFAATCGNNLYSPNLTNLGTGPGGAAGVNAFISMDLGVANTVTKAGYTLTMSSSGGAVATAPATCNGLAAGMATSGYNATATATTGSGTKDFGTNTSSTIYYVPATGAPMAMTDTQAPAGAQVIGQ